MGKRIRTMYVVHHSHTNIGYTALQERVLDGHVDYIRTVLELMKRKENADFRWNCETCFCVEQFLGQASPEEEEEFWQLVREGKLGFSSNYLNFNDLADSEILDRKLKTLLQAARAHGAKPKTAMFADINGISMGQRDAMIKNGTEFLYMNIHCHHGMYPLFANQTAFRWENKDGQSLLVWNGEHYNLGNALGIQPNPGNNYMGETYFGKKEHFSDADRLYHLCGRLDQNAYQKYGELAAIAENNLLLYAEHTWGHSATVRNPYETMVSDLGIRKNSYASKAHEQLP